ncbi:MAG: NTP transferase domain-containing protein [Gemmatimonadetes bacterium]|nr:NTP transferase domain-containing protein [Candidatus Palauibacter rhopaloidicola]
MSPPLTLVILAAGRSTRFGRLKQLAPIGPGSEALLDYALYDAAIAGFTRFLLVIRETLRPDFDAHLRGAATQLDIRYAYQRMAHPGLVDDPPAGRIRPWGTGFAVLTAGEEVDGPFAVCNADDFYGRGAYAALARAMRDAHTRSVNPATPSAAASAGDSLHADDPGSGTRATRSTFPTRAITIGYPLEVTMSESGGVSRGLCEIDESGGLRRLTEGLELRRDGDRAVGRDVAGRPLDVPVQTPVCTNLWGFQPDILPPLRDLFAAFLASRPGLDREFYLSEAVNDLIAAGRASCTVLPTRERWLGVTFPDDHAGVAESLRGLVDSGVYLMRLWDGGPSLRDAPPPVRDARPSPFSRD